MQDRRDEIHLCLTVHKDNLSGKLKTSFKSQILIKLLLFVLALYFITMKPVMHLYGLKHSVVQNTNTQYGTLQGMRLSRGSLEVKAAVGVHIASPVQIRAH